MPKRTRAQQIEHQKIMARLRQLVLRGCTNQTELAAAFGVQQATVSYWIRDLHIEIIGEQIEDAKLDFAMRIEELNEIRRLAFESYERTTQPIPVIRPEECIACNGEGKDEVKPNVYETCKACDGVGMVRVVKQEKQPGEPAYLNVAKECVKEIAKMKGQYPKTAVFGAVQKYAETLPDGTVKEKIQAMYAKAPVDDLIAAKVALAKLDESVQKKLEKQ